jgi:hypothetical protein
MQANASIAASDAQYASKTCSECWWLMAYAHGPYLNHPVVSTASFKIGAEAAAMAAKGAERTQLTAK